jgi:hypothetical protein
MRTRTTRTIARRTALASALLTAIAGMTVAGAAPAEAHQVCMDFGRNWGCVSKNHQTVSAHDEQCDNQSFYTQYRTTEIPGATFTIADRNGCSAGGTYDTVTPYVVTAIRVCSPLNDCMAWKTA